MLQQTQAPWITSDEDGNLSDDSMENALSDSDSDASWISMSPITSDEEDNQSDFSHSSPDDDDSECSDDEHEMEATTPSNPISTSGSPPNQRQTPTCKSLNSVTRYGKYTQCKFMLVSNTFIVGSLALYHF